MKTQRSFASLCLVVSCCAFVAATNVTVGEQPGVVRLTSAGQPPADPPAPVPPADGEGSVTITDGAPPNPGATGAPGNQGAQNAPAITNGGPPIVQEGTPAFVDPQGGFDSIFEQSGAATASPVLGRQPFSNPLAGPQVMFESNIGEGPGVAESYHRLNARIPWHINPDRTVLFGDLSASISDQNDEIYNIGLMLRGYDNTRNRVTGIGVYWDEEHTDSGDWNRLSAAFESLGQFSSFRWNGYLMNGDDSLVMAETVVGTLIQSGNGIARTRRQTRVNAYSGMDFEVGGPLPVLGRRGINLYGGGYWLDNEFGKETYGFAARAEVLVSNNATVNVRGTKDDNFGTNVWVSLAYSVPNYFENTLLQPRDVRQQLADPVQRRSRIQTNVEVVDVPEAVINTKTGVAWNLVYVDPNATGPGTGTFEDPFGTLAAASTLNNAAPGIDVIQVTPRIDDTGTNLTVPGGITLRECQSLVSSAKDFTLFTEGGVPFVLSGTANPSGLGPLISNPTIAATTDSVVRVATGSTVRGFRIDASATNAVGVTTFGTGISNPMAATDVSISCNNIFNYTNGIVLNGVSGNIAIDENTVDGTPGTSVEGVLVTTTPGTLTNLLVRNNTVNDNSANGIKATVTTGGTLNADNPAGLTRGGVAEGPSGILGNTVTGNGDGIFVELDAGATGRVIVDNNISSNNTLNGFHGESDNATFDLVSLAGNTFDMNGTHGAFLHYLNGGSFTSVTEEINEDTNLNGQLDPGEDLNGNGLLDVPNGLLDAGEDRNMNGRLDHGIVTNTFSNNMIAGLCIFGEGSPTIDNSGTGGAGVFDIGGDTPNLGNIFNGNLGAGIVVDVKDSATYRTNTINNIITSAQVAANNPPTLTFVLDFWEASQGNFTDSFGNVITPFDVTSFGFTATDFDLVTNAVLGQVRDHYYSIPTVSNDARSPLADGQQLSIDFVLGDIGTAPSNGATEYYYHVIGGSPTPGTPLGVAWGSAARNAGGTGPNFGFTTADQIGSIYSDNINGLGGLTPADIGNDEPLGGHHDLGIAGDNVALLDALTSGNLTFTRNALAGTISHEIGHNLSLAHLNAAGAVTPTGAPPIMGTGAIDTSNQARIGLREFAYSGQNAQAGNATQMHVQQLINAVGTRSAFQSGVSGDGIVINAVDQGVIQASTWRNNLIENNTGDAFSLTVNDSARAEGVTIQSNTLRNNSGRGIDLVANGANASIEASNTIGGSGTNTIGGTAFAQGNTISGNQNDGIRVLASQGGTIRGNAINNTISENAGNGIALLIDGGGHVLFGDAMNNQIISGNMITGNAGAGILAISTVNATVSDMQQTMDILVQGNMITQNVSGGIVAELNGVNNVPPGPPLPGFAMNNVLNLNIGQTTLPLTTPVLTEQNVIDQNGEVGIGLTVGGTGLANVNIFGNTITNTTAGTNALFNGDGINLIRRDSSLLLANVFNNTATGNASNGLEVDVQGTDRNNQNQPMVGTANMVNWNNNLFMTNTENGASFRTRGDAQLIAHGLSNVASNNMLSGVLVTTSEFSSFGDPTAPQPTIPASFVPPLGATLTPAMLAPGIDSTLTHSMFVGLTAEGNGRDGVELQATETSNLLVAISSSRIPTASGAHGALNTTGDTSISNNGRDGVHIESGGVSGINGTPGLSMPNVLITAQAPPGTLPPQAMTIISGNGTGGSGGNGVFWDAFNGSNGIVRVFNTTIINNIAGASEDANGDGILTFAEDTNGNFDQNQIGTGGFQAGLGGNLDIDVANGDGVQFNSFHGASDTLIVGSVGMGNVIQANGDDGIAITADITRASNEFPTVTPPGVSVVTSVTTTTPTVTIQGNTIGGTRDGVPAGNSGDGISIRSFGVTSVATPTGMIDSSLPPADMDGLSIQGGAGDGVTAPGNTLPIGSAMNITVDQNVIANNNRNGVNIRLNGGNGAPNFQFPFFTGLRPIPLAGNLPTIDQFTFTNNTIVSNGEHGIFMRSDADMNQDRFILVPNPAMGTPGPFSWTTVFNSATGILPPGPVVSWPQDISLNLPFLNFGTVQNSLLTVTGNTIQNNGTNAVIGHGIEIRSGTSTYIGADVQNNIFGGNLETDFTTSSINSAITVTGNTATRLDPFTSVNNSGAGTHDIVYLDDAALLDVRFTGNTGDQINPLELAGFSGGAATQTGAVNEFDATYNNVDPYKRNGGFTSAVAFKIDDFPNINANNPLNFTSSGMIQDLSLFPGFGAYTLQNLSAEPIWPEDPYLDVD